MRAYKGDFKNPSSKLYKSILDQRWSLFAGMLEYKQAWQGGEVIYVSPHHTSQTCPKCGHVSADNRMSQSEFACTVCRYNDNADIVGAKNILARGHRVLACGETVLADSMKQEPKAA